MARAKLLLQLSHQACPEVIARSFAGKNADLISHRS